MFTPGLQDTVFWRLAEAGFYQASHFSLGGRWKTSAELTEPTGPYHLDFLRALQLSHFLKSIPPPSNVQLLITFEDICSTRGVLPHTLSLTYALLHTSTPDFVPPGLLKWEKELNCSFNITKRQQILRFTHKSSICAKTQEKNYKIISHWYRTPALLHKYFPMTSELCWRCQAEKGTLLHVFWSCSKLTNFWQTIRTTMQKFTDYNITNDPAFFLLHASNIPTKTYKKSVIGHLLDAAKACIPLNWKSPKPPTIDLWIKKLEEIKKMEDLIHTAQNRHEKFSNTWQLWNMFIYSSEGQALRETAIAH